MLDILVKIVALAAFAVSLAALGIYVPSADLIAVLGIVFAMAVYDFLLRPLLARNRRRRA
jgi:hypothetical protein